MPAPTNQTEFRRLRVQQLILSGVKGGREIHRQLVASGIQCSHMTVARDLQVIYERMAAELDPEKVEQYRAEQLGKLAQMEQALARASLGFEGEATTRDLELAVQAGRQRLKILDHQAKLLGLYAPTHIAVDDYAPLIEMLKKAEKVKSSAGK